MKCQNLRLAAFITTLLPQGLFVGRNKISMPQDEVSLPMVNLYLRGLQIFSGTHNPMYLWGLIAVDRMEIIETILRRLES